MGRNKYQAPEVAVDEVDVPLVEDEIASVEQQPVADVEPAIDDALLLKVDHTHAGVKYAMGTPVAELNVSAKALEFLKKHGVI